MENDLVSYLAHVIILDDDVAQKFCYFFQLVMDYSGTFMLCDILSALTNIKFDLLCTLDNNEISSIGQLCLEICNSRAKKQELANKRKDFQTIDSACEWLFQCKIGWICWSRNVVAKSK